MIPVLSFNDVPGPLLLAFPSFAYSLGLGIPFLTRLQLAVVNWQAPL